MSQHKTKAVVAEIHNLPPYKLSSYVVGFVLSLYLTVMVYIAVVHQLFTRRVLLFVLPISALLQFVVQLVFFLHIGRELKPRWKLLAFCFMLLIVIILVAGSIWIMANLNYHAQSPAEINRYLRTQDRL
jgi:cytochrome o ubiquinol oxidase operon protein cyoD